MYNNNTIWNFSYYKIETLHANMESKIWDSQSRSSSSPQNSIRPPRKKNIPLFVLSPLFNVLHSSQFHCICWTKTSSKMLQNLPYFIHTSMCTKTYVFIRELKHLGGTFCQAQITKYGWVVERRRRRHDDHHIEPWRVNGIMQNRQFLGRKTTLPMYHQ